MFVGGEVSTSARLGQTRAAQGRDQADVIRVQEMQDDHQAASAGGAVSGNQRRPIHSATDTSRISTGTSTNGPMTAAKATGEVRPKAAMATAMASSKLFEAAVKARAVVRG